MDKAPLGHKGSLQKCGRRASAPTGVQSEGAASAGLDKSQGAGIIKITQGPATSGFASDYALVTKKSKPSLGRVAVSACNADRHRKTKKVKRDRYRHIHPPFRETKPPIAVLGPQGFHRTGYILPNKSKNVNLGRYRSAPGVCPGRVFRITGHSISWLTTGAGLSSCSGWDSRRLRCLSVVA